MVGPLNTAGPRAVRADPAGRVTPDTSRSASDWAAALFAAARADEDWVDEDWVDEDWVDEDWVDEDWVDEDWVDEVTDETPGFWEAGGSDLPADAHAVSSTAAAARTAAAKPAGCTCVLPIASPHATRSAAGHQVGQDRPGAATASRTSRPRDVKPTVATSYLTFTLRSGPARIASVRRRFEQRPSRAMHPPAQKPVPHLKHPGGRRHHLVLGRRVSPDRTTAADTHEQTERAALEVADVNGAASGAKTHAANAQGMIRM